MTESKEYADLAWRIEIPVASRVASEECDPTITLKLSLSNGDDVWLSTDPDALARLVQTVEEAAAALKSPPYGRINQIVK